MRNKYMLIGAVVGMVVGVLLSSAVFVWAGNPDSPAAPGATNSFTLEDIYNRLDSGADGAQSTFTEPGVAPGTGTMHTLNETMAKAPAEDDANGAVPGEVLTGKTYWSLRTDGTWGTQTGIAAAGNDVDGPDGSKTFNIPDGLYSGKTCTANDLDLQAGNIKSGVNIFGVEGTLTPGGTAIAADLFNGKTGHLTVDWTLDTGTLDLACNDPAFNGTANRVADAYDGGGNGLNRWCMTDSGDALAGDILSGKVAWVNGAEVTGNIETRTLSDSSTTVAAGYYAATTLDAVDADLAAGNIVSDTVMFGIIGTYPWAGVPKTGQTKCYTETVNSEVTCPATDFPGQDGELQKGVAWPNPRFTKHGDGTVTDNLTGLMWLQDANCITTQYSGFDNDDVAGDGKVTWQHALEFVAGINAGTYPNCCAGHTDWWLPNVREMQSLVHYGFKNPAVPNTAGTGKWTDGDPFDNVQPNLYWSSTTSESNASLAWRVHLNTGLVDAQKKTSWRYVWPVRGGQ
jgi:hypothetical protein